MNAVLSAILPVLAAAGLMLMNGVVLIYMLRKVLGHLHLRLGPVHLGPKGILQTTADVLKLLSKEDIMPTGVDRWMYVLAPAVVFVPSLTAYAALPFSETLRIVRLETGLLFTFAVLSIVPLGVIMAGWASANKYSLIGALRAAAQQIAYEVPLLLSVLPVVMIVGSLDLGEIVAFQSGVWMGILPRWLVLLLFPSFVIFLVAALCELNQTPFDMSEAESELVAGFATEYSSMKFGLIFLSEFSNSFVISALAVTMFFGGWTLPFLPESVVAPLAPVIFVLKTYIGIFVLMWIRGTLPRVRIDQLMNLGWKWLIPASLVWIVLVGVVMKLAAVGGVS
ncbi:MAG: NADH-quinone oxidoreductase subunit NuoH [Coriobacteriia bacterium]|jgi:NADH-quinone oxidoreductase subunit H|nr:NADH-quinone oxidoreductase subunit NuoH [Coriobacteriia bacterium]